VFQGGQDLHRIEQTARELSRRQPFGLFGTSIAATWLDAQLGGTAGFFVDEDPGRVGRSHLGRPILAPPSIPRGAGVYVALPQSIAVRVAARISRPDLVLGYPGS
jgi:hypothetical protein